VRNDPSAPRTLGQHLVWCRCLFPGVLQFVHLEMAFIPRYSGRDSSFIGLVIVIGPVDSVDKPHRCRWSDCGPVDGPWTVTVDNLTCLWMSSGYPQATRRCHVVTHRFQCVIHRLSSLGSQARYNAQNTCPQSYPQAVDGAGCRRDIRLVTGGLHRLHCCGQPCGQRCGPRSHDCYRDWFRIRLVSSVTWL
jgi:hypothetical protein